MSAQDNVSRAQLGPYLHVSPHKIAENAMILPGGSPGNFVSHPDYASYAHATTSESRADWYRENFEETAHERGLPEGFTPHVYEVQPTGPLEPDPEDREAVRSRYPMRVLRPASYPRTEQAREEQEDALETYNAHAEDARNTSLPHEDREYARGRAHEALSWLR